MNENIPDLGPLPEPHGSIICYTGKYSTGGYVAEVQVADVRSVAAPLYTADQMHAYAAQERAAGVAAGVPAGHIVVPRWVLERASDSLGSFVSDHGWAQIDMDAMDDIDSYLARSPTPPAEPAEPVPALGITGCNCRWKHDEQVEWCELHLAHREAIHEWAARAKAAEKKLAAAPPQAVQPPQPVQAQAAELAPGVGEWLQQARDALDAACGAFAAAEPYLPNGCSAEFTFYASWEDVKKALDDAPTGPAPGYTRGDIVRKRAGAAWEGRVCGEYSTALTPQGYAVESSSHAGSVQIYPAAALELVTRHEPAAPAKDAT